MRNALKYSLALLFVSYHALAQPCADTRRGKLRNGNVIESVLFVSENYWGLYFGKETNPSDKSLRPRYYLALNSLPKSKLADSLVGTYGDFELLLTNGVHILFKEALANINPVASNTPLGFGLELSPEQMQQITAPIERVTVFHLLSTNFSPSEQQKIGALVQCFNAGGPQH
ncbi:hypothetical protein [Taibaiella koreensis]|uniref:hypothetical protein n=1 Tax=Taibaiella koreensis TaxID=1268548 RepID=UPI0013C34872|nr:hypothetical protein [Taibaiella koreensis]